jgi:hypothetical protein
MDHFSQQDYAILFDRLLSQELCYDSSAASESNIKRAMKRILGRAIKEGMLKGYSNLVLSETLDVHFMIRDSENSIFDLVLYYGK